jgi:hypothetical protein
MQRIGLLFLGAFALIVEGAEAQQAAGAELWRVIGTTLATPPALATGAAAAFWNPAQTTDSAPARVQLAIEAIQTPDAIDATGIISAVRARAGALGEVGLTYGRVGLTDITQTIDSPDPTGAIVPVYTSALEATWSRRIGSTGVGATVAFHQTRLDTQLVERWSLDFGANQRIGSRLRVAAATHFFSSLKTNDPAQDVYGGVELQLWKGVVSGEGATLYGRYGIAFAHGFTADHQLGLGTDLGKVFGFDVLLAREGSYGGTGWRPVAGLRLAIGKYCITLARDAGVNDLGSAYRIGVDARFR